MFVELFAVVVSLLIYRDGFLEHLGSISIYLQWCFLIICGIVVLV